MRAAWAAALIGCAAGGAVRSAPASPGDAPRSTLAEDDLYRPAYGVAELQRALIAERGLEATREAAIERRVTELEARAANPAADDPLRVAAADLAVHRRFIATLEACEAGGRWCPPRLDDPPWSFDPDPEAAPGAAPPLTAALRFDLDSWRVVAAELHGRACACRTLACVDSLGAAIDQLELRPAPEVLGDDAAAISITRARECLFRLRGKGRLGAPRSTAE